MKPFGQWLNDCAGASDKREVDPAYVDEVSEEFESQYDKEAAPSVQWVVPCKCINCGKYLNSRHFGLAPDEVRGDEAILCNDCWGE